VTALDRGLAILDYVAANGPTTAEAISEGIGLPLSTTYRYVNMLRGNNYLADYEGHFDLGTRMLRTLRAGALNRCLAALAGPTMFALVTRVAETALLTVRDGWSATCIERVEPHRAVRLSFRRNVSLPLHLGASAKPLLAHMDPQSIDDYLASRAPLSAKVDTDELRDQLAAIRRDGISSTSGELDRDAVAIGVPVYWDNEVAACLSVAGPRARLNGRRLRDTETQVRSAGAQITALLSTGSGAITDEVRVG
jgi:DNA-binding IclR family transcriptional regulator